jgi:hypothetical protein
LGFFGVLVGVPRETIEEGGHYVFICVLLRLNWVGFWGYYPVKVLGVT